MKCRQIFCWLIPFYLYISRSIFSIFQLFFQQFSLRTRTRGSPGYWCTIWAGLWFLIRFYSYSYGVLYTMSVVAAILNFQFTLKNVDCWSKIIQATLHQMVQKIQMRIVLKYFPHNDLIIWQPSWIVHPHKKWPFHD